MNGAYKDDDNESLPPPVDIGVSSKRPTGFTSGGLTLTSEPDALHTPSYELTAFVVGGGGHQPQAAFQPGATPWKEKRRYLGECNTFKHIHTGKLTLRAAFNHVGIIHAVDRDMHHLVTVEFHDRGAHRGYHFDDNYKFSMASLGQSYFNIRSDS